MGERAAVLDEIAEKWLRECPSCDAGMPMACSHPDEDYRPTMLWLVERVAEQTETIRALGDAYREAIGVPPSEHQSRRLEAMASRIEELTTLASSSRPASEERDRG